MSSQAYLAHAVGTGKNIPIGVTILQAASHRCVVTPAAEYTRLCMYDEEVSNTHHDGMLHISKECQPCCELQQLQLR